MDEDELDEEDSGETTGDYEWCATGGSCATCEALDGITFTSAPEIAHPHCDCEVRPAEGPRPAYTDCENSRDFSGGSTWTGPHLVMHVDITITCWDGSSISDTVDVDFGNDPVIDVDTLVDEVWDAVHDHVEELAARNCPPCSPTPVG